MGGDREDDIEGGIERAIIIALGKTRDHLGIDNLVANSIGETTFEAIASADRDLAVGFGGRLSLDEDDEAIVMIAMSDAPRFANTLSNIHNLGTTKSRGDDDKDLIGGRVGKNVKTMFESGHLIGIEDMSIVVDEAIGRLRDPLCPQRGEAEDERQRTKKKKTT